MFLGRDGFQFSAELRKSLEKALHVAGYNAKAAIPEIEVAVELFLVLRESPLPGRECFERIEALENALERAANALEHIDPPGRDMVTAALMRTGAPLNCLEKAFENYSRALELVRRGRRRMARAGRPTERSRDRLVDELRVVLERHRRTSRAKMLEILARHGLERDDDPGAALREVVRIVFKAVREPLPIDLAKITRRVGGRNPARSK